MSDLDIPALKRWLKAQPGVQIQPPTNEWEVARWRFAGKSAIIYVNKKGRRTFVGEALAHVDAFRTGGVLVKPEGPEAQHHRKLTLYTDASHRTKTKAGAWAGVLRVPGEKRAFDASGPLRGEVGSSTAAEAMAVANSLHHFLREKLIRRADEVTIFCDNSPVVDRLNRVNRSKKSPDTAAAIAVAFDLAHRHALKIKAEWIKGHMALDSSHHAQWNRRCDKLCGRHGKKLHNTRLKAPTEGARA